MAQPLTLTNLRNYALRGTSELKLEGEGDDKSIQVSEGSWAKRLVRNLTQWFAPAGHQDQYMGAKAKVLEALKGMARLPELGASAARPGYPSTPPCVPNTLTLSPY